jgi:type IV secretory pathway VirB2 component (pilin)
MSATAALLCGIALDTGLRDERRRHTALDALVAALQAAEVLCVVATLYLATAPAEWRWKAAHLAGVVVVLALATAAAGWRATMLSVCGAAIALEAAQTLNALVA